jgi:ABC-2 type transport system ATP-binding protein
VTSPLLSAKSLSRFYGPQLAVNQLDFEIYKGEVLGFLGPNGAGKSTSMKMLSGNLAPSEGEITINGYDLLSQPKQAKAHIGYLPEQPPLYKELSVVEFLSFCGRINQIPSNKRKQAVNTAIDRCGLGNVKKRLIGNLSKGYQQRVGIAQAIVHTPAVIILDEPTSGLDPIQIRDIRKLIKDIAQEHSVILSTHILPEVEMLCDRVKIINQGSLVFNDTTQALQQQMKSSSLLVTLESAPSIEILEQLHGVNIVTALSDSRFKIQYKPDHNPTQTLLESAITQQWQLTSLSPEQHSLEDVFMNIIRQEDQQQGDTL